MCSPEQQPQQVRYHESDEADDPRDGDAACCDAAGPAQEHAAHVARPHAQLTRLRVAEGEHVEVARMAHDGGKSEHQRGQQHGGMRPATALQAAHDPEDDARYRLLVQRLHE